jgi:hypothetical protein
MTEEDLYDNIVKLLKQVEHSFEIKGPLSTIALRSITDRFITTAKYTHAFVIDKDMDCRYQIHEYMSDIRQTRVDLVNQSEKTGFISEGKLIENIGNAMNNIIEANEHDLIDDCERGD